MKKWKREPGYKEDPIAKKVWLEMEKYYLSGKSIPIFMERSKAVVTKPYVM